MSLFNTTKTERTLQYNITLCRHKRQITATDNVEGEKWTENKTNSVAFSPQVNYTD
jgi:hypothetical protein